MKTIAMVNQKGGVGKTTTTWALMAGLTRKGFKVLAVDIDSQGNLSATLKAGRDGPSSLGVLMGEANIRDAIQHTAAGDIVASKKGLAGADGFITGKGKEYRLRKALEPLSIEYDYVLIDCPPALGILSTNALAAADSIIIPAKAERYSLDGIIDLSDTIDVIREYCNPKLTIEGILLTQYNGRAVLSREARKLAEGIAAKLGTRVFQATIRSSVTIQEAQMVSEDIFSYAPRSKVAADYQQLLEELLA